MGREGEARGTNRIRHQLGASAWKPVSGDGTKGHVTGKPACPLACQASAPDTLISLITGYRLCIYKCSSTLLDLSIFLADTAALDITASVVDYLFCKYLYVKWKEILPIRLEDPVLLIPISRPGNEFTFGP